MLRTILGVVAGYVIFATSAVALFRVAHQDTFAPASVGFMSGSIVCGIFFGAVAGYIAAAIARQTVAAVAVGIIILLGAVVSMFMRPPGTAVWANVAALLLMAPAAIVGGMLRTRHKHAAAGN